jgi:hypothetical protein
MPADHSSLAGESSTHPTLWKSNDRARQTPIEPPGSAIYDAAQAVRIKQYAGENHVEELEGQSGAILAQGALERESCLLGVPPDAAVAAAAQVRQPIYHSFGRAVAALPATRRAAARGLERPLIDEPS